MRTGCIPQADEAFQGRSACADETDQPCCFWFTEQGLKRFADAIDEINQCVFPSGWEVRGIVLWDARDELSVPGQLSDHALAGIRRLSPLCEFLVRNGSYGF